MFLDLDDAVLVEPQTVRCCLLGSGANPACVKERAICISKKNQKITNLRYLIYVVRFSTRKESKKMSRIKRYAEELYGEDWVHKLEEKEDEESRK